MSENAFWKDFFLKRWKHQTATLKIKNWRAFYLARLSAEEAISDLDWEPAHPIENCELEFSCPYVMERLVENLAVDGSALCNECGKKVYVVNNQEEVREIAVPLAVAPSPFQLVSILHAR